MISGQLKMHDIVFDNPRILLVLENFNISLGFGEQTIQEICEKYNINEDLFLTIANLYCCKETVTIDVQYFGATEAKQLLQFLKSSHTYFLNEKIPQLKMLIDQKAEKSPSEKYSKIIKKFIHDYAAEVFIHMNYENTVVFPYVESLLKKQKRNTTYTIDQFRKHHSNIEDKLIDLKNLLIKHVPPEYDSVVRRRMLFELYDLELDIGIHDYIENNLLIPIVERLEMEQK